VVVTGRDADYSTYGVQVPPALQEQLKPGGRIVIPIGYPNMSQELLVLEKDESGKFTPRDILSVVFVPLTGEE